MDQNNGHKDHEHAQAANPREVRGLLDKDVTKEGTWVVVRDGVAKYIGRVHEINGKTVGKDGAGKREVLEAEDIALKPCLEFLTPLRPTQVGGQVRYQQDPIVKTLDFLMELLPVYVRPTNVYFFSDISELDAFAYKHFVNSALNEAEQAALHRRAEASGLVLPNGQPAIAIKGS